MTESDTLPKLLKQAYEKYKDKKVAVRRKDLGIWNEYTWKDYYENVKYFSLGLVSLGLKPAKKVAIIGDNDVEYYGAEYAAQATGGVVVPLYSDAGHAEVEFTVGHSESTFVVAHDQEQVDKLLKVQNELPNLRKIIYWDPKGLWNYEEPILISWEEVLRQGRKYEEEHGEVFEENIAKGKGDDLALILYTSGTTGVPKGAMLTHENLLFSTRSYLGAQGLTEEDEYFSYMSPAWMTEQIYGLAGGPYLGMTTNFAEEAGTVQEDVREIGPTIIFYGSRLWESTASTIQVKIADTAAIKRFIYRLCLPIGQKMFKLNIESKEASFFWKAVYKLAWVALFGPLLDKLGLSKVRIAYTGGTVLSPESFSFIGALGLGLRQVYGSTEAGVIAGHRDYIKPHTLGESPRGADVKIKKGEIVVRSPGVFQGYYKNPEETAKVLKDGWFHTGDAGFFDEDVHLVFMDRVPELLELPDGERFAPQFIESTLRFSPYIKDAMILGGKDKPYISAVIIIDYENIGKWAEDHKVVYTTFTDLSQKAEVCDLIQKEVEKTNESLPSTAKIKKFVNLHKEFDPDEAELTRTRKLRRGFMEDKYRELVDAIYSNKKDLTAEAYVRYRDGRTGKITTSVNIKSLD